LRLQRGAKEIIVGTLDSRPLGWHLLVKTDSTVKTMADLDGKTIGMPGVGGNAEMYSKTMARKVGATVRPVPLGGAVVPSLLNGQVDAIVTLPPMSLELIVPGKGRSIVDFGSQLDPLIGAAWAVRTETLQKKPDDVRKTLSALYKATRYMQNNPEWAKA